MVGARRGAGGGMDRRDRVERDGPSDGARTGGWQGPGFVVAGFFLRAFVVAGWVGRVG